MAAKARREAKQERIIKAHIAAGLDANRAIVKANLSSRIERNYYPQSSMAGMLASSHRAYICQPSRRGRGGHGKDNQSARSSYWLVD